MQVPPKVVLAFVVAANMTSCDSNATRPAELGAKPGGDAAGDAASTDGLGANGPESPDRPHAMPRSPDAGRLMDAGQLPRGDADADADLCWDAVLPIIVLHSSGGDQAGVQGSYCATALGASCSSCVDKDIEPDQFTVVHRGDELTFSMENGVLVPGTRCNPPCPPTLRVETASCDLPGETVLALNEDEPWSVDLDVGAYHLWVDSHFEADNGDTGQTYTGFGLIVSDSAPLGVVTTADADAGCTR